MKAAEVDLMLSRSSSFLTAHHEINTQVSSVTPGSGNLSFCLSLADSLTSHASTGRHHFGWFRLKTKMEVTYFCAINTGTVLPQWLGIMCAIEAKNDNHLKNIMKRRGLFRMALQLEQLSAHQPPFSSQTGPHSLNNEEQKPLTVSHSVTFQPMSLPSTGSARMEAGRCDQCQTGSHYQETDNAERETGTVQWNHRVVCCCAL